MLADADIRPQLSGAESSALIIGASLLAQRSGILADSAAADALKLEIVKLLKSANVNSRCAGLMILSLTGALFTHDEELVGLVTQLAAPGAGAFEVSAFAELALKMLE